MLHANNGFYFKRREDGSFVVSLWLSGVSNPGRADAAPLRVFVREAVLTPSEWASMSARGESGETHTEATLFHEKGCPECRDANQEPRS